MNEQRPDLGFTLIEVLLVILVLGLMGMVVTAAARGISSEAQATSCAADARQMATAVESYFAKSVAQLIPAADASPDGYELTLVAEGFLRSTSEFFDLDELGVVTPAAGSPCTL